MHSIKEKFQLGVQYVDVVSAVTKDELTSTDKTQPDLDGYSMAKFIPASGAASRMFKNLYAYLEDGENTDFIEHFFNHLKDFAFYGEMGRHIDLDELDTQDAKDRTTIIKTLLNGKMHYGKRPKALIPFHQYEDQVTTPIDEHIYEGEQYLGSDPVHLHFTISEEHEEAFNEYVEKATEEKGSSHISYSFQKERTDTMAVDLDNDPFYLENGEILYRPGGHGALLDNLNDLEEDIVFIKNIDNVCHRDRIQDTIESKKRLAAIGVETKEQIDRHIRALLADDYDLAEIGGFLAGTLNIRLKGELTKDRVLNLLNRPLRVCGVVKNEGEPGGGPYVVDNGDYTDLQICEKSEINLDDEAKADILNTSEYFNPVDVVCFTKDYKGEKFNLLKYTNKERYFISEKTHEGRPLKAFEHPGLWNGAMHNWNTLFVEVPLTTFNPVKTVNDLLKKGHQAL